MHFRLATLWVLITVFGLAGCQRPPVDMNPMLEPERIALRYGSHDELVVFQSEKNRVSLHVSDGKAGPIARTVAYHWFMAPLRHPEAVREAIADGTPISQTLADGGVRQSLAVTHLPADPAFAPIYQRMRIKPRDLAVFRYAVVLPRELGGVPLAAVTEIYHPDHLRVSELETLYPDTPDVTEKTRARYVESTRGAAKFICEQLEAEDAEAQASPAR